MKKKIVIISICLILITSIIGIVYLCNLYDKNLVDPSNIVTDPEFKDVTYNQVEDSEELEDDILGILTIEKIRIKSKS